MAVFRVNKSSGYTVMSNFHLRDRRLSLKAKGLLSLILSLPDEWSYSIGGLVAICIEKEVAVKTTLTELKKNGYLRIDKIKPCKENGGRYEYIYNIFEQPIEIQGVEIQGVEIQPLEIQPLENIPLYKGTNQLNTDLSTTYKTTTDDVSAKPPHTRFIPPTFEEVKSYCIERHNKVDAQRFVDYYTSNGWKVGRNPMKDWKATVRTWERGNKQEQKSTGNVFLDLVQGGVYDD